MDYKGLVLKGPIFELLWTEYAKMKNNCKKDAKYQILYILVIYLCPKSGFPIR
jgi:hypothetical protein